MGVMRAPTHHPDHQNGPRLEERAALDAPEVWPDALLEKCERLLTVVTQLSNFIAALGVDNREFASGAPPGGIPEGDMRTNAVDRATHPCLGQRGPNELRVAERKWLAQAKWPVSESSA
jgi:hypothetical protein